MSKRAKLNNREKRLQEKRSRRAANKARYAEWKRIGVNGKSKRFRRKKRIVIIENHFYGFCGNVGCKRCFPNMK